MLTGRTIKRGFDIKSKIKRVSRVIKKTRGLTPSDKTPASLLSSNKVTGYSLNFPIAGTCLPSKLCVETCYYAAGASSWDASLRKQMWLLDECRADPISFAKRVVKEYRKKRLTFLRWNGGGDLFPEAVESINHIGSVYPDVVLWIVTRNVDLAPTVADHPNLHLHFSLDQYSLDRGAKVRPQMSRPIFFSYQCAKGEKPDIHRLAEEHHISLFFFDNYVLTDTRYVDDDYRRYICPLNYNRTSTGDITGSCGQCRKCFDGHWLRTAHDETSI